jgi:hypothetical protein
MASASRDWCDDCARSIPCRAEYYPARLLPSFSGIGDAVAGGLDCAAALDGECEIVYSDGRSSAIGVADLVGAYDLAECSGVRMPMGSGKSCDS